MAEERFEGEDLLRSLHEPDENEQGDGAFTEIARQALEREAAWKQTAKDELLRTSLSLSPPTQKQNLGVSERADVIAVAGKYDGDDDFIDEEMRETAQRCLSGILDFGADAKSQRQEVISQVLLAHIKPLFLPSPHPAVNLETGRRLPRDAGGSHAFKDFWDDQSWKTEGRGCWNTIRWCVRQLEPEDIERLWPLLIPPTMTIIDDQDALYKFRGTKIVKELLERVNPALLSRTGIGGLLTKSLSISLTDFSSLTSTALLFPLSISCSQILIEKTTSPGTPERYEGMAELVSAVIGGAWLYGNQNVQVMETAVETIIPLIDALGVGCARFLNALIPQFAFNLITQPPPFVRPPQLQISSARALTLLTKKCKHRIPAWKQQIADALLRSWVYNEEHGKDHALYIEIKSGLQSLSNGLLAACPEIEEVLMKRGVFQPLLSPSGHRGG